MIFFVLEYAQTQSNKCTEADMQLKKLVKSRRAAACLERHVSLRDVRQATGRARTEHLQSSVKLLLNYTSS